MKIHLGLGSNTGDRRNHLRNAIEQLERRNVPLLRASPVIETPALLPDDAPWEWNKPFLNMAIECEASCTPDELRHHIADIQTLFGRDHTSRWSPRPIDIDILLWGDAVISTDKLTIPHRDLLQRHFVLTPMIALNATLQVPGHEDRTLLHYSTQLDHHIPLWMGILNITPDSFSDGGKNRNLDDALATIHEMVEHGCNILDIGGESTRPKAETIDPAKEWQRIGPVIDQINHHYGNDVLRPGLSIDTRNAVVAQQAIENGASFINDVSGLQHPAMLELAAASNCEWIAMHSMSVPADPDITLPPESDPVEEVGKWLEQQLEVWDKAGIPLNRIVFDPGIGFGKNSLQSLKLLQKTEIWRDYGLRLLVGHSRKSFLNQFTGKTTHERDMATIGAAMQLCQQGVDILRVHNIPDHLAAYRGWAHLAE